MAKASYTASKKQTARDTANTPLVTLANKIATDLYNEAKKQGVLGTLRRSDFMADAYKYARMVLAVVVKAADLPVIPYKAFKDTELVIHSGSCTWWMRNKIGSKKGSGGGQDDIDLRVYEQFEDGYYKNKAGVEIKQTTDDMLSYALYTHQRKTWRRQWTFTLSDGGALAWIKEKHYFIRSDKLEALPDWLKDLYLSDL